MSQSYHEAISRKLRYLHSQQGEVIGALGPAEVEVVNDGEKVAMTIRIPLYEVNELGQLVRKGFEGLNEQVRTGHLDTNLSIRFGPAPDFEPEAVE